MRDVLIELVDGAELDADRAGEVFGRVMDGQADPLHVASLLTVLSTRGPAVGEIVGLTRVMRQRVRPVTVPDGLTVIDTCGMGGTHSRLFNVSTA
ncbi:MAG: anthranilate phosphoribosyltransferase, partial [Planctomycetota bacterium]